MSINNISNINTNSPPSPLIMKILWRQQQELLTKSPDGVKIIINHEDTLDIQADIIGPQETPYEGGTFRVKILVSSEFPYTAPKGIFMTKIYHPNVSEKGEICVNTLKKDWSPKGWSLYNVLEVIKCLLIIPFPESSLNEEAGKLFMEDYNEYFKIASIFTQVYAMPQIEVQDNNHRDDTSHHNNKSTNNLSNNFSNNNSNTFNSNFEIRNECHAGENFSTYDCHMETARNMDIIMNTNLNVNFNHNYENNNISLKNKSLSSEINYFENNDNNTRNSFYFNNIDNNRINTPSNNFSTTTNPLNFYTPNTQNGKLEYELLSRMHSKSMSLKQNHSLLKSKNSLLMLDRKSSNFSNGDSNLMMNKPNINNLPFILRSNSFRNNENVNLLKVSQNSHMGTMNFQTPNATPHRSKKDEIKKWLSRI